ncbi:hypothetical protein [Halorubrum trueperi]|uniref:Rubrerythrin-like domain-containing protein n=1 Tax=Halorubrum trueperi TaxID=2004704 RepID=A0ABD5UF83_9EURY
MTDFEYEDSGDNCVVCNSKLEPDRYICTTCTLANRFGGPAKLAGC